MVLICAYFDNHSGINTMSGAPIDEQTTARSMMMHQRSFACFDEFDNRNGNSRGQSWQQSDTFNMNIKVLDCFTHINIIEMGPRIATYCALAQRAGSEGLGAWPSFDSSLLCE